VDIRFSEKTLDRMETEPAFTGGLSPALVSAYRSRIQALRAAPQEQALLQLQSFDFRERANAKHAVRVTDDWDLLVAFENANGTRVAVVEALVQRTTTKTEPAL
jgi:plasmid maintenance system killer protein